MPFKPQKPGRETPDSGSSGKSSGRLRGLISGFGGSIAGGNFTPGSPAGEGSIDISKGIQGVEGKPATLGSITPYSVNHPIMDMFFNQGRGSATAAQLNAQIALAQLAGEQGLANIAAQNRGQLDVQGLRNTGELDVEKTRGQNTIANTTEQGNQSRLTAAQGHDLGLPGMVNLPSSRLSDFNTRIAPTTLAGLEQEGLNQNTRAEMIGEALKHPDSQPAMNQFVQGQLLSPMADVLNKAITVAPGSMVQAVSPHGFLTAYGRGQSGTSTTSKKVFDPKTGGTTTTETTSPVAGSNPMPFVSNIQDSPEEYQKFKASQSTTGPTVPTFNNNSTQPVNTFGAGAQEPMDPLLRLGGIQLRPTIGLSGPATPDAIPSGSNSPLNPANAYKPAPTSNPGPFLNGPIPNDVSLMPDWLKKLSESLKAGLNPLSN